MRWLIRSLIVVTVALQGWTAIRLSRFDVDFRAGRRRYEEGRFVEALDRLESARRISEADSETWTWMGDAASGIYDSREGGRWPEVEGRSLLRRAWAGYAGSVLRCPLDAYSWSGLAEVAAREVRLDDLTGGVDMARLQRRSRGVLDGKYAAALAAAKLAVRLKPSGFQELDVLAALYERMGEVERARETYVQSARMMPAPSYHSWGDGTRLVKPLYEAILDGLKQGLKKAPPFEQSLLNRDVGKFALAQGDTQSALEHLRTAEETGTGFDLYYAHYELAAAFEAVQRYDEAIEALKRARSAGFPPAPVSRRIGDIALRIGRAAEACTELRQSLLEYSREEGLRVQASLACERAGEIDMAERLLREGFVLPTDSLALSRALVDLYERAGRHNTATSLLETWARDYPQQKEFQRWSAAMPRTQP